MWGCVGTGPGLDATQLLFCFPNISPLNATVGMDGWAGGSGSWCADESAEDDWKNSSTADM